MQMCHGLSGSSDKPFHNFAQTQQVCNMYSYPPMYLTTSNEDEFQEVMQETALIRNCTIQIYLCLYVYFMQKIEFCPL